MKRKPFTYFLCAITIIIIVISPILILPLYEEQSETASYKGILSMWHITDWRTGGSSSAAFLKRRITEFESNHPHVFIEVEQMTLQQANEAVQLGNIPDIISYPSTYEITIPLSSLPAATFNPAFAGNTHKSYPYMCGGYCIIVNMEMLDENGVMPPDGWGIRPETLLDSVQYGLLFDAEDGYSALPAMAMHQYPELEGPNISTWGSPEVPDAALSLPLTQNEDALKAFCKSEVCVLLASHRQLFEVTRAYEQNEAPSFSAFAIGGYTDMVQWVSVPQSEDALRESMCIAFTEYLVSQRVQKKLTALGVIPVVTDLEIYENDDCRAAMYDLFCDEAAVVPPSQLQALEALAIEAFNGDNRSLRRLRQLLRKVRSP